MGFDSPWLLLGILGALVPMAIHIHLRRHAPVVSLDALMHLVLTGSRTRVRLRLIHAMLLAARVGIVVLLAILFARPFVRLSAVAGFNSGRPVALAVVLDDSMSMRLSWDGATSWSRARTQVLRTLAELPPESEVFVVLAGRPAEAWPEPGRPSTRDLAALGPAGTRALPLGEGPGGGWDADVAARFVARLSPGYSATDLSGAVRKAARRVRGSTCTDRRIHVVSDFFDHGTDGFPTPDELVGLEMVPVDVGPRVHPANRAVVDATAAPAPDVSPGHARVRATVLNDADAPFDDLVTVQIGQGSVARRVACPPRTRCPSEFLVPVEEGSATGEVRVSADELPVDDVRAFPLAPRNQNAVLVVDGSRRRRADLDEGFFLTRALAVRVGDDAGFAVTVVRPDELSPLHLAAVGTVALLNVGRLRPEQIGSLSDFAAAGGGVLVTLGDNATPDGIRPLADALLPAPLRDVVDLGTGPRPGAGVAWVRPGHPGVAALAGLPPEATAGSVSRIAVLEDGWAAGSAVVARVDGGLPLLVERRIGKGLAVTWLTTADRDWTDLPVRPAWPSLVRGLVAWLRGAGGGTSQPAVTVGDARRVDVPEGFERAVVTPPAGAPVTVSFPGDQVTAVLPGPYRVAWFAPGRPAAVRTEAFVANPDPEESRLSRDRGPPSRSMRADLAHREPEGPPFRKYPLWPPLLLAVLGLLLAEAWLRGKA